MADSSVPADSAPPAQVTQVSAAEEPEPLRGRLEEMAREENERAQKRRLSKADFASRGERLLADVPPRFFALCTGLRQAVNRFNAGLDGGEYTLPLHYEESPGVTLKDASVDDLRVTVWRRGGRFELILRFMQRAGKPPLPIIEGYGAYGQSLDERIMIRIEGWVEGGQTVFWYRVDFRKMEIDLGELPERIVMSVLQVEPVVLYRNLKAATDEGQADEADA